MRCATAIKTGLGLLLCLGWVGAVLAQVAGEVTHLSGPLLALKPDGSQRALSVASRVENGDELVTADNTYARVRFTDSGEVTLKPGSRFKVESYHYEAATPARDSLVFSLFKGAMRTISGLVGKRGNPDAYRLQSPTATIGIRGTTVFTEVIPGIAGQVPPQTVIKFESGFGWVAPLTPSPMAPVPSHSFPPQEQRVSVGTLQTFSVVPGQVPVPVPNAPGLMHFNPPPFFPPSSFPPSPQPALGGLGGGGAAPGGSGGSSADCQVR